MTFIGHICLCFSIFYTFQWEYHQKNQTTTEKKSIQNDIRSGIALPSKGTFDQTFFVQIKYSKAKVFLLWTDTSVRLIFHVLEWIEWIATLIFILLKFACISFLSFLLNWVGKLTQHTTDTCKNYFNVCPRLLLLWTNTRRRRVTTNTCKDIFMNEFFFTFLIITSGAHPWSALSESF